MSGFTVLYSCHVGEAVITLFVLFSVKLALGSVTCYWTAGKGILRNKYKVMSLGGLISVMYF